MMLKAACGCLTRPSIRALFKPLAASSCQSVRYLRYLRPPRANPCDLQHLWLPRANRCAIASSCK
eukprot:14973408-Heterocapsa_arctica.AAC.1